MSMIQSMLKNNLKACNVTLQEVSSGYRVSTRAVGDMFNILLVDDDVVVLNSDNLQLRKIISLRSIVEIELQ